MPGSIEVFADIRCPFTHVGLTRFVERRRELGREGPTLVVRSWPLELVNRAPLDPTLIAHEVAALREQVAPDLFLGFDRATFPSSSLGALATAAAAYRTRTLVGETVSLELRAAMFERGIDIGDDAWLAALRTEQAIEGLTPADEQQVLDDWDEGRRRGVVGSPHFFIGDEGFFCPTLDITHVDGELRVRTDETALASFLSQVFGG